MLQGTWDQVASTQPKDICNNIRINFILTATIMMATTTTILIVTVAIDSIHHQQCAALFQQRPSLAGCDSLRAR